MSDRIPGQRFSSQPTFSTPDAALEDSPWQTPGPPAPVTPQRYRSNAPIIGIVAGVLVLVIAALLVVWGTRPQTGSSAATTPSQSTPALPTGYTPSPDWQGIEFTAPNYPASGYWQVSQPVWDGDFVTITTTVSVDSGTMLFSFFALDNQQSNNYYDTVDGTMQTGSVSAGESQTGTVVLRMPRGDFTFYLATGRGVQVAALLIGG